MADWADVIRDRLSGLNLDPVREAEIIEELSQHLDDRYHELLAQSLPEAQARQTAVEEAGANSSLVNELIRIERVIQKEPPIIGGPSMSNILSDVFRDLRYAVRSLAKARGFTAVALVCLALGTGGATAIFSVGKPVLLSPLPYKNADRLCVLFKEFRFLDDDNLNGAVPSEDYLEWKSSAHSFDQIEAFSTYDASLAGAEEAIRIHVAQATPGLFDTLGTGPVMGRTFSDEQAPDAPFLPGSEQEGRPAVGLISNRLWRAFFGSDKEIVCKTVKLDGSVVTVVGVMPQGFEFPDRTDFWVPTKVTVNDNGYQHNSIALLKDGVTRKQGRLELQEISDRLIKSGHQSLAVSVVSLRDYLAGDVKLMLLVLLIAAGFVLLIACANVASLLVARGASQKRETAIRASLGASRGRILRQLLTESVLLSLAGAAAGTLLAVLGVKAFVALVPVKVPGQAAAIDGWVLAFSLSVAVITGLLFGLAPALLASFADTNAGLKDTGAGYTGGGVGRSRLSRLLVAAEVALAIVLLAGAGLMIRSFVTLTNTRLGFNSAGVYTMNVSLPFSIYQNPVQMTGFYQAALERIRLLPGVTAA
ncbi:MAG TPA: ABC transporter permease, partial [Blastocatellia bacterium]